MQPLLNELYEKWKKPKQSPSPSLASLRGPDLVWAPSEYCSTKPSVTIVGQQQKDCDYSYAEFMDGWTIEQAVKTYEDFNFAENYEYKGSFFWQFFHSIRVHFHGEKASRRSVAWLNLVKFVMPDRNSILGQAVERQALAFQNGIFRNELEILNPDICIFVTGPDYDRILAEFYPGIVFDDVGLGVRLLAQLQHAELPRLSFRTHHPQPLRGMGNWNRVLEKVFEITDVPRT